MLIIWDDSVSLGDNHAREWAESAAANNIHQQVRVGTAAMLDALRVQVMKGKIDHATTTVLFKGREIRIDKNGRLEEWPEGMADAREILLETLLGIRETLLGRRV